MKEEACPSQHARRGPKGLHEAEEKGAINGIVRFGDVNVDVGTRSVVAGQDMGEQRGEVDVVLNTPVREVGGLFWAYGGSQRCAKACS